MPWNWECDRNDWFLHPEYVWETLENDIALLRLPRPCPIKTVLLPDSSMDAEYLRTKRVIASGFGRTNQGTKGKMKKTTLRVLANGFCHSAENQTYPIRPTKICTETVSKDGLRPGMCRGDSGGPLFSNNAHGPKILYGVSSSSRGEKDCSNVTWSLFTRVTSFLPWIQKLMDENEPSS